jgi:ribosomal protein S18 acetylase RimI-like enzyme
MSTVQVRPFRRSDRHQLTSLVNAHVQAVVPGVSVSVNSVLNQLEREPGEFIVDPWVTDRVTLVAEQRGRICAAAHLLRYGPGAEVAENMRDSGEIRWLLAWPDASFWPDATAAGTAVAEAAVSVLRGWRVRKMHADVALPSPGVYGLPEQWPHVLALLTEVGFVPGKRVELVLLADVDRIPRPPAPRPDLQLVRTLGVNGTRFSAQLGDEVLGMIEVDTGIGEVGPLAGHVGWADIGNLEVTEKHRRQGIGSWLLGRAADWLRLGRVDRLLAYATPDETAELAFLTRAGFEQLTRTAREWHLPCP